MLAGSRRGTRETISVSSSSMFARVILKQRNVWISQTGQRGVQHRRNSMRDSASKEGKPNRGTKSTCESTPMNASGMGMTIVSFLSAPQQRALYIAKSNDGSCYVRYLHKAQRFRLFTPAFQYVCLATPNTLIDCSDFQRLPTPRLSQE